MDLDWNMERENDVRSQETEAGGERYGTLWTESTMRIEPKRVHVLLTTTAKNPKA
jgi:hypothetical protein